MKHSGRELILTIMSMQYIYDDDVTFGCKQILTTARVGRYLFLETQFPLKNLKVMSSLAGWSINKHATFLSLKDT